MKIIDISSPITRSMPVWPGDPPVYLRAISKIDQGDDANVTEIQMSVHTGTHIDAASHFIEGGQTIDQIPLSKLIGEVLVMDIDQTVISISEHILRMHSQYKNLLQSKKVLFKTRNSSYWVDYSSNFYKDYIGIDASGAEFLGQLDLDLVGMDYLSIAPYDEINQPHQILLSREIVLLEGINLSSTPEGVYQLYCLPMNIVGCEGAPARAILLDPSS